MKIGEVKQFDYTGGVQSITLERGLYQFEAYGASGGAMSFNHTVGSSGGPGGYTKARFILKKAATIYVIVGQAGVYGSGSTSGSYNGGGKGGNSASGSGGGATDFRLGINALEYRFLVAGGGGGCDNAGGGPGGGDDGSGGSGGGLTAQGAWINGRYYASYGGSQTNGTLGIGENGSNTDTGGGGGGYRGGKATRNNNGGAGGGSSFIYSYPGADTTYNSNFVNDMQLFSSTDNIALDQQARSGNGLAKITRLNIETCNVKIVDVGKVEGFVNGEKEVSVYCGENVNLSVVEDLQKGIFQFWKDNDQIYNSRKQKNVTIRTKNEWENTVHIIYCTCIDIPDRRNEDFYKDSHDQYVYNADRLKRVIGV